MGVRHHRHGDGGRSPTRQFERKAAPNDKGTFAPGACVYLLSVRGRRGRKGAGGGDGCRRYSPIVSVLLTKYVEVAFFKEERTEEVPEYVAACTQFTAKTTKHVFRVRLGSGRPQQALPSVVYRNSVVCDLRPRCVQCTPSMLLYHNTST